MIRMLDAPRRVVVAQMEVDIRLDDSVERVVAVSDFGRQQLRTEKILPGR